jgi:hypothetical protein
MIPDAYRIWHQRVAQAALTFEGRWTMLALRRLDPVLADRLGEQVGRFHRVCVVGQPGAIARHGEATVKGYAEAGQRLEQAEVPDDAYQIGRCPRTGTMIVVGERKAVLERAQALYGPNVIHFTADELATLVGSVQALKDIAAIKLKWPGADVTGAKEKEATP